MSYRSPRRAPRTRRRDGFCFQRHVPAPSQKWGKARGHVRGSRAEQGGGNRRLKGGKKKAEPGGLSTDDVSRTSRRCVSGVYDAAAGTHTRAWRAGDDLEAADCDRICTSQREPNPPTNRSGAESSRRVVTLSHQRHQLHRGSGARTSLIKATEARSRGTPSRCRAAIVRRENLVP